MLKATMGMLQLYAVPQPKSTLRVVPTTCDWVVKFQELAEASFTQTCFLELPHLRRKEKGHKRWEMIGRLREKYPPASKRYNVQMLADETPVAEVPAKAVVWTKREPDDIECRFEGCYVPHTH